MSPRKAKRNSVTETIAVGEISNNIVDWQTKYNDLDAKYQELKNSNDKLQIDYEQLRKKYSKFRKHMSEKGV